MRKLFRTITAYRNGLSMDQRIRWKTITSFSLLFLFFALGYEGWQWLNNQPKKNDLPAPIRSVLNGNEKIFGKIFSNNHTAKTYPVSAAAKQVRVNGNEGVRDNFDTATWALQLVRKPGDTLHISINDIKKLPKTDVVFDFKCIEGWSQVTHWAGVKFSDFAAYYHLPVAQLKYMGLATPDKEYYVGIDMPSALHPQTILCYEMNDKPLPYKQGAPLRLIIPVKYGIKHLKRIGTMFFSNERPPDYWAERGYDYYAGM
jgi:DMSO/TMAO reductase YedYZ molybdopterin-dependent catalytic subunit